MELPRELTIDGLSGYYAVSDWIYQFSMYQTT